MKIDKYLDLFFEITIVVLVCLSGAFMVGFGIILLHNILIGSGYIVLTHCLYNFVQYVIAFEFNREMWTDNLHLDIIE